jgi:hypothetical protein
MSNDVKKNPKSRISVVVNFACAKVVAVFKTD